ncbi:uncharacterized protein PAF06_013760 [Gastrophryne carolinensis]
MANYSVYHNANFQSFVRHHYPQPSPVQTKYDAIRCQAQRQHAQEATRRAKSSTVYAGEYRDKEMDANCRPVMRPSSPTRMNKPHPPGIFLVTTLHNLPGYYNCKDTEQKGEASADNAALRQQHKGALRREPNQVHIFCDTNSNTAAEAWLQLANDKDRSSVKKMLTFVAKRHAEKIETNIIRNTAFWRLTNHVKPEFLSSAQHWLLQAGKEDIAAVERLLHTLSTMNQTTTLKDVAESFPDNSVKWSQIVGWINSNEENLKFRGGEDYY